MLFFFLMPNPYFAIRSIIKAINEIDRRAVRGDYLHNRIIHDSESNNDINSFRVIGDNFARTNYSRPRLDFTARNYGETYGGIASLLDGIGDLASLATPVYAPAAGVALLTRPFAKVFRSFHKIGKGVGNALYYGDRSISSTKQLLDSVGAKPEVASVSSEFTPPSSSSSSDHPYYSSYYPRGIATTEPDKFYIYPYNASRYRKRRYRRRKFKFYRRSYRNRSY